MGGRRSASPGSGREPEELVGGQVRARPQARTYCRRRAAAAAASPAAEATASRGSEGPKAELRLPAPPRPADAGASLFANPSPPASRGPRPSHRGTERGAPAPCPAASASGRCALRLPRQPAPVVARACAPRPGSAPVAPRLLQRTLQLQPAPPAQPPAPAGHPALARRVRPPVGQASAMSLFLVTAFRTPSVWLRQRGSWAGGPPGPQVVSEWQATGATLTRPASSLRRALYTPCLLTPGMPEGQGAVCPFHRREKAGLAGNRDGAARLRCPPPPQGCAQG